MIEREEFIKLLEKLTSRKYIRKWVFVCDKFDTMVASYYFKRYNSNKRSTRVYISTNTYFDGANYFIHKFILNDKEVRMPAMPSNFFRKVRLFYRMRELKKDRKKTKQILRQFRCCK